MIKLLDCTTRDGGHSFNWDYPDEYIFNLISFLNKNGFCFYEIGYRNYYDADNKGRFYHCTPEMLEKFYNQKGNLQLGIMVDTKRYNDIDFIGNKNDFVDFVRIATHPDKIENTLNIAENLKSKNYNVMIQLMDMTNLAEEHFKLLKNWKHKDIISVLYLADTYGIIEPENIPYFYQKLQTIGYINIGFHAHNRNANALANTLKFIELGAFSADVTQNGIGINGGNLEYQELCKHINIC